MRVRLAALLVLLPIPAAAQPVIAGGLDGGVTLFRTNVETSSGEPATQDGTSVSLGLEMLNFMWAFDRFMVGVTLEGSLFGAGPQPSNGIEFMFGPRVAWRAHDFLHLQASGGVLLSAFEDRCGGSIEPLPCEVATRPSEPTSVGYGLTFSAFLPFDFDSFTLLVGPTVRRRVANYPYTDTGGGEFYLRTWQIVLGTQFMLRLE